MTKTEKYLKNRRDEIAAAATDDADGVLYAKDTSDAILLFLDAYDKERTAIKPPILPSNDAHERDDHLSTSSRLSYASTLHRTAQHIDLLDCSARELNTYADDRRKGDHPDVKEGGLSANTIHQNQIAWRKFLRFHHAHPDGFDVRADPDSIALTDRDSGKVDERDMFDEDEIQALRHACQNKRDRALLEMLIYTGQRHNALRQLKFRDVRPDKGESGTLYLPDVDEGLKGAEGKRPLLGAQKAARDWRRAHPTQEPDDAFFTHLYDWDGHDDIEPGDHLSRQTFGDTMKRLGDRAGVNKPTNPHQFRHYFVTMAAGKHSMSFDTIRHLIGHEPDSRELERTYQHLIDDDHIENAESDMGIREERTESLTPPVCPTCDEPLNPSWSVCPECERIFGPDAQQVKDEVQQSATQDALTDLNDREKEDLRELMDVVADPTVLNQLIALSNATDEDDDPFGAAPVPSPGDD